MTPKEKITESTNFPTNAKPIFIRLGMLLAVIISILLYIWFSDKPPVNDNKIKKLVPDNLADILED